MPLLVTPILALALGATSFDAMRAELEASRARPGYEGYAEIFRHSKAFPPAGMLARCERVATGPVALLVRLDEGGNTTEVVADSDDRAARCFVAAFTDIRFEAPPTAPIVLRVDFKPR